MCVVSMISDHYMDKYPQPAMWPTPNGGWTIPKEYADYQELLRKAKLYDEMTKQKDCPAPDKVEWQKALEKFMKDKYGLKPKGAKNA